MIFMQRAAIAILGCAGLIAGCQTVQTTAPGAVGIERKQQMLVSSEQVDQILGMFEAAGRATGCIG